jgi:hypothetical protein
MDRVFADTGHGIALLNPRRVAEPLTLNLRHPEILTQGLCNLPG